MGQTSWERMDKKRGEGRREQTLKRGSEMVGLGKVNGGNKDNGLKLGMMRDGSLLA